MSKPGLSCRQQQRSRTEVTSEETKAEHSKRQKGSCPRGRKCRWRYSQPSCAQNNSQYDLHSHAPCERPQSMKAPAIEKNAKKHLGGPWHQPAVWPRKDLCDCFTKTITHPEYAGVRASKGHFGQNSMPKGRDVDWVNVEVQQNRARVRGRAAISQCESKRCSNIAANSEPMISRLLIFFL